MALRRAPFIVVEGLDRSGKTTQTSLLHARLRAAGSEARLMKFPDRTTAIGKMIDSYLKSQSNLDDHAIHLLFSANRWELASTITALLTTSTPTPVLCDRYAFSGIAFSAAKSLPDLPFEWCRTPDVGLPAPDLTIFLDISPEAAKARGGYGEERYEQEELQRRVRGVFARIGQEMNANAKGKWVVVDAGRDVDVVARELWALVEPLVKDGVEDPVGRLWEDKLR